MGRRAEWQRVISQVTDDVRYQALFVQVDASARDISDYRIH